MSEVAKPPVRGKRRASNPVVVVAVAKTTTASGYCENCGSELTGHCGWGPSKRRFCNALCRVAAHNRKIREQAVIDATADLKARVIALEEKLASCTCGAAQHAR